MNASPPPAALVRSVCPYCGVGCGIVMEVRAGKVVRISGDRDHPTNAGRLCTKGTTAHQAIDAPGRLMQARLRDRATGESRITPMTAAIAEVARRLRGILDAHGPDAIALYVSGQMSMEAQYLANKLAKGFLRTRHIESNSRLCMASAGSGYKLSLGADAPPGSYDDFEKADLFLVIGANMADCHPILFLRMMDRVKAGAKLIVVDPRRTATAEKADLFLQLRPGSDLSLLNGLLHILLRDGRIDRDFIARHTEGWEEMPAFLSPYTPEAVARTTGLTAEAIETAARMIGEAGEWMSLWTMGLNQSTHGTWNTNAVCNLHLATGAICRPGSGPFSLTGQPNAMGGREMGYMGPGLPGQRSALSAEDRAFVERVWRLPSGTIRAEAGDGTVAMWEAMAAGRVKACWIICTNPVASMANRARVVEALGRAEFVILQDVFEETETAAHADILLPAALWAEAAGVMVNSERNLTLAPRAVDPPGEAMADWEIIARVARGMGFAEGFAHTSAAEVFEEIAAFANPATGYDTSGTSHARLAERPVQWPAAPGGADRNPIRYLTPDGPRFPTQSGRAMFWPRPHQDPAEMPDDAHPLVLTTGRVQHQWHTLTKTGRIPTLTRLNPAPFVEINPADALGIADGDTVILRSRRGQVRLPAVLNDRMRPGTCFAPFHWADAFGEGIAVNAVTSDAVDPISLQPELKHCAVSLIPAPKPPRAERKDDPQMSRIDMLAELLGLDPVDPIALEAEERSYMQGFLGALRAGGGLESGGFGVPVLPASAPLAPARRLLLDGMLAGVFSRSHVSVGGSAQASGDEVLILWASQTGNAEAIAADCATRLTAPGRRIRTLGMDAITPERLAGAGTVIFIASTFGDGDAPDNAAAFWRLLDEVAMPRLEGLRYALLALGDPSYAQFCGFGRRLDARLVALGAAPLLPRRECEPDYRETVEDWLTGLAGVLDRTAGPESPRHGRDNPLPARLKANRLLSGPGSAKEVRQIVFDAEGSALSYEPGDALGVWPVNAPAEVTRFITSLSLDPQEKVVVKGKGEMVLSDALARHYDLTRLSPELAALMEDAAPGDTETGGVLLARPAALSATEILTSLRRLQPRFYSISCSPAQHPGEVHLTMSTLRFEDGRGGVCSSFLADRAEAGAVEIFVQKSPHFRLPADPAGDAIMIGPGTGIAPFRAFLQQRAAMGASGRNWLFFGEQRSDCDFYYREELEALMARDVLTRLDTAFSRDQQEKIYVQDRMRAAGADLWRWIEGGAHVYVCGDAARMARDVDHALATLIAEHGGLSATAARNRLEEMARARRYVRDVY